MRVGQGCFTRLPRVATYNSEVSWVVPTRVIRPKPLEGYSHDTGVSTGGPVTAVTGVVARDTPRVQGSAWGRATALRCMSYDAPWARCTGLGKQPEAQEAAKCTSRRRDGQVDSMVGVLRMTWRSGRCCLEGYAELQVTVYWGHGGMRGSNGVRMVGVTGAARRYWGAV